MTESNSSLIPLGNWILHQPCHFLNHGITISAGLPLIEPQIPRARLIENDRRRERIRRPGPSRRTSRCRRIVIPPGRNQLRIDSLNTRVLIPTRMSAVSLKKSAKGHRSSWPANSPLRTDVMRPPGLLREVVQHGSLRSAIPVDHDNLLKTLPRKLHAHARHPKVKLTTRGLANPICSRRNCK